MNGPIAMTAWMYEQDKLDLISEEEEELGVEQEWEMDLGEVRGVKIAELVYLI